MAPGGKSTGKVGVIAKFFYNCVFRKRGPWRGSNTEAQESNTAFLSLPNEKHDTLGREDCKKVNSITKLKLEKKC